MLELYGCDMSSEKPLEVVDLGGYDRTQLHLLMQCKGLSPEDLPSAVPRAPDGATACKESVDAVAAAASAHWHSIAHYTAVFLIVLLAACLCVWRCGDAHQIRHIIPKAKDEDDDVVPPTRIGARHGELELAHKI